MTLELERALADEAEAAECIVEVGVISLICKHENHPFVRKVIEETERHVVDDFLRKTQVAMDLEVQLR